MSPELETVGALARKCTFRRVDSIDGRSVRARATAGGGREVFGYGHTVDTAVYDLALRLREFGLEAEDRFK